MPKWSIPPQFPDARYSTREIINALKYRLHNGCTWRALPHDFPPWNIVYHHFRKWSKLGIFSKVNTAFRQQYRATLPQKQNVAEINIENCHSSDETLKKTYSANIADLSSNPTSDVLSESIPSTQHVESIEKIISPDLPQARKKLKMTLNMK